MSLVWLAMFEEVILSQRRVEAKLLPVFWTYRVGWEAVTGVAAETDFCFLLLFCGSRGVCEPGGWFEWRKGGLFVP